MNSPKQIGPTTKMYDQLIREDGQYSTHIDLNLEMRFPKLQNPINITFFDNLMKLHSIIDSKYNEYTKYGNKDLSSLVLVAVLAILYKTWNSFNISPVTLHSIWSTL